MALFEDTQDLLTKIANDEAIVARPSTLTEACQAQEAATSAASTGMLEEEFARVAKGVLEHEMGRFTEKLEQVVRDILEGHIRREPVAQPSMLRKLSFATQEELEVEAEDHEWMQRPWFSHFYSGPARQSAPDELTAIGTPKHISSKNLSLFHRPTLPDRPPRKKQQHRFATNSSASSNLSAPLDGAITELSSAGASSCTSTPTLGEARASSAPELSSALTEFEPPSAPRGGAGQKKMRAPFEELPGALVTHPDGVPETTIMILQEMGTESDVAMGTQRTSTGKKRHQNLMVSIDDDSEPRSLPPLAMTPVSKQVTPVEKGVTKDSDSPIFSTYKPRSSGVSLLHSAESERPATGHARPSTGNGRPSTGNTRPTSAGETSSAGSDSKYNSVPSTLKDRFQRLTKGRVDSFRLSGADEFTDGEEELPPSLRSGPEARLKEESAKDLGMRSCRPSIRNMVQSEWFDYMIALLVAVSAVLVGIRADRSITNVDEPEPEGFQHVELAFCIIFLLEIVLRVYTYRCGFFWYSPDWLWNWFDTILVVLQSLTEVLERASYHRNVGVSLLYMRMLRALRYVRIVRLVRIVHFIHQLRTMVASVAATTRSLGWTLVLIGCMIYTVGVLITLVIAEYARNDASLLEEGRPLHKFYGSLARVLLSLYQAFTGGVDWDNLVTPLTDDLSPVFAVLFSLYIGFAVLAMLNVITGVFVESALTNTKIQDDIELVNNMRELFKSIDFADAGQITWDQFKCQLSKPGMEVYFKAIDLDVREARGLFKLLDLDNSGSISRDEFVMGCLRLRGPAKAIDLATLMYDNRRILQSWRNHAASMQRTLNSIARALDLHQRC